MSLIRPLERHDLPEVAGLYELVMRSGGPAAPPGLAPYFEHTLLDHPWADPEIPSLVHLDDAGRIVGFQGSSVRRAHFDGRPIRIACAGQLVAHPQARNRAVGALLMRAYLAGPQDLTLTDGATEAMREIWTLSGGEMAHLRCIGWARVLRPWRFAGERLLRGGEALSGQREFRRAQRMLDRATTRWTPYFSPPVAPTVTVEQLTPSALLEQLPLVAKRLRLRLRLDYDEPYLRWLFSELAVVGARGMPVAHLVRDRDDGRTLGWYVYYLLPGGISQVLQVAAGERDVGRVLDQLLHHAFSGGAVAVQGRVEPALLAPLASRRCLMRYAGAALISSREEDLLAATVSPRSLLTRLDGEWWMGHHVLDFGGRA